MKHLLFLSNLLALLCHIPLSVTGQSSSPPEITYTKVFPGHFTNPQCWAYTGGFPSGFSSPKPAFADIDGDGDRDLFFGVSNYLWFYKNQGTVSAPCWMLVSQSYKSIMVPNGYAAPFFADIDNDGDNDLFVGNGGSACAGGVVRFYENTGSKQEAEFALVDDTLANLNMCDRSVPFLVDYDFDGDFDLFVGDGYGDVGFCRNIGTPDSAVWSTIIVWTGSNWPQWRAVPLLANVDQDSTLELLLGHSHGTVWLYDNISPTLDTIIWQRISTNYTGESFGTDQHAFPVRENVDNDPEIELMVVKTDYGDPEFHIFDNLGTVTQPQWEHTEQYFLTFDMGTSTVAQFWDMDDDGRLDMFIANSSGEIYHYRNTSPSGEPNWVLQTKKWLDFDFGFNARFVFYDLDGNKTPEMFVWKYDGFIEVYRNTGQPGSPAYTLENNPALAALDIPAGTPLVTDIDGDQYADLFICNGVNGKVWRFENAGTPQNPDWQFRTDDFFPGEYARPLTFFDYDGDSLLDAFLANSSNVTYLKNMGTSTQPAFEKVTNKFGEINSGNPNTLVWLDFDVSCGPELWIGQNSGGLTRWQYDGIKPEIQPIAPPSNVICDTSGVQQFQAVPPGDTWSGDVNAAGQVNPDTLDTSDGGTFYAIYTYTDAFYGCVTKSDTLFFHVKICTSPTSDPFGVSTFSISPNPAIEFVRIDFEAEEPGSVTWRLFSADGRELWSTISTGQGISFDLDLTKIPTGVYCLEAYE